MEKEKGEGEGKGEGVGEGKGVGEGEEEEEILMNIFYVFEIAGESSIACAEYSALEVLWRYNCFQVCICSLAHSCAMVISRCAFAPWLIIMLW